MATEDTMSEIKIACLGDVMLGESFYAMGHGVATGLRRWGRDFLDAEIVSFLKEHDIVLCNVECALSDIGKARYSLRRSQMRGQAQDAELLHDWGITVASVSNNHILEHGFAAAVDTATNLKAAGMGVVGAGEKDDFGEGMGQIHLSFGDQTISMMGVCLRKEKYSYCLRQWETLLEAIRAAMKHGDQVIVSIHWGDELIDRPSLETRKLAKELTDMGVVLVAGHHPHVAQGIEETQNGLVAYSLGNFIFSGFWPDTCWSVILSVTLSDNRVTEWCYKIIEKDDEHRPHFVKGMRLADLEQEMQHRNGLSNSPIPSDEAYEQAYREDLARLQKAAQQQLHQYIRDKFWSYSPIYWPQVLMRPIRRRLGLW